MQSGLYGAAAGGGKEKYTAQAWAVLALSRYSLGVPVAGATQWDQAERMADCAYPVFEPMKRLAAQGEVIFQDDPHARLLAVIKENRKAAEAMVSGQAEPRTGMYTTGLVANAGEPTICL